MKRVVAISFFCFVLFAVYNPAAYGWFDETHMAIAKAAGYKKWYNAAAADISRIKLGKREGCNHYHNSPQGRIITMEMVLSQADRYDTIDPDGHLYGAIIAAYRAYRSARQGNQYAENYMAYLIHYVGDLSMPLHHTPYNAFNRQNHMANDGVINNEVLAQVDKIEIHPVVVRSERDLAREVARIANLSKKLGHRLEAENRIMTHDEAYRQIALSASLLKGVLSQ